MIDLKATYGDRYRIELDESANLGGISRDEMPWYYRVACQHGHVYLHGENTLGAFSGGLIVGKRLLALPGVTPHQRGDLEVSVTFPPDLFPEVAALLKPLKRRRLSDEHKARLMESNTTHRFRPKASPPDHPATVPSDQIRGQDRSAGVGTVRSIVRRHGSLWRAVDPCFAARPPIATLGNLGNSTMRPYGPKAGRVVPRRLGGVRIRPERDPEAPRTAATAAVVLEVSEDWRLVKCGPLRADQWTGEMRPHGKAAIWCPRPRRRAIGVGDPVVIYLDGVGDDGAERWRVEA